MTADLRGFMVMCRVLQIYREKIKAAVEGRPFTPPPPSAVQVNVGSSGSSSARPGSRPGSAGAGSFSNGSRPAAGSHDEWGDWGDKPAAPNGATAGAGGFSSNSEYSRAQYMASAANKEEFFARKMQENNSKPDHLPPSQGGKYVGFGSTPAPRPPSGMQAGGGSVDDVAALLSKGLASLGQVAGVAATTATTVVQSGTQNINQLLQEKQVGQTLQQTSKVVAEKAQVRAAVARVSVAWVAASMWKRAALNSLSCIVLQSSHTDKVHVQQLCVVCIHAHGLLALGNYG
jgi:ADP-ribosylation factor GTPase-activating protein 1